MCNTDSVDEKTATVFKCLPVCVLPVFQYLPMKWAEEKVLSYVLYR